MCSPDPEALLNMPWLNNTVSVLNFISLLLSDFKLTTFTLLIAPFVQFVYQISQKKSQYLWNKHITAWEMLCTIFIHLLIRIRKRMSEHSKQVSFLILILILLLYYSSKAKNTHLLQVSVRNFKKVKSKNWENLVYYKANSYLKTKWLIKEFLKCIVLILGFKQLSFLRL